MPNKPKKKAKNKQKPLKIVAFLRRVFAWVIIFTFILSVIVPLGFALLYRNKVYPNVMVGPYNLSGLTKKEAVSLLNQKYQNLPSTQFRLTYQGKEWVIPATTWGIQIDTLKTVENAYRIGRDSSVFKNIITFLRIQKKPAFIPLEITFNEELFSQTSEKLKEEINIPMVSPSLTVNKDKVTVTSGIGGIRLDVDQFRLGIIRTISQNVSYNLSLPVVNVKPPFTKTEEELTYKRAISLQPKKLTIIIGDNYYDVESQELISLLSFTGGFDTEKISSLSANLAKAFDKEPQNAAFNFENGRVTVFKPGKEGQIINQEKSVPLLNDSLVQLETTTSAKLTASLPIVTTPPEITTDEVNDLGIKELIGRGISYFRGSIASRIHNIVLASAKLNGVLIKPGEIFSFNNAVGDISAATGYQQAYIIQSGRTVLGDGGGVCQVSTTLFRAALNSGLPIVERYAHAYRVAYYEQGFGAGLDATVFAPANDLKIKNDTPAHILIQTNVDQANMQLTFELYGSSDGRKAYISTPRIWDQAPPPPPKYEDDPTMPIGTEKQVDWAAWGAKAAFDYKVVRGEEVLINKTFYSNFRPWQAVYLRGTKT
ncbi:MAG: VanW family protein [Patescibacteria group bacterium]|nr:VanW family protein [Patescibacteria group bacterium]